MLSVITTLALCAPLLSTTIAAPTELEGLRGLNSLLNLGTTPTSVLVPRADQTSDSVCGVQTSYSTCVTSETSSNNCNQILPGLYPLAKGSQDPKYSIDEAPLRGAIHIPQGFDKNKPAIILVPGTGSPTYYQYRDTLIWLMQQDGLNPVWINPQYQYTQFSTSDAAMTAEFVAYAIGYMNALTGKKVVIIGVSQGSMNVQWALKYWASTQCKVADFIALSGDFKGTNKLGQASGVKAFHDRCGSRCDIIAAAWQQIAGSAFANALNSKGGDSALVPTTSIWSNQDEVIEPNDGSDANVVSAMLKNDHGKGMTGVNIQDVCKSHPQGNTAPPTGSKDAYTHISTVWHPITYAIIKDAITHEGPADLKRIGDLSKLCSQDSEENSRLPKDATGNMGFWLYMWNGCSHDAGIYKTTVQEPALRSYAA